MNETNQSGTRIQIELNQNHEVQLISINGIPYGVYPLEPPPASSDTCHKDLSPNHQESFSHHRDSPKDALELAHLGRRTLLRQTRNGAATLLLLLMLEVAIEYFWYRHDFALLDQYALWIFYLDLTVVSLVVTIGYLRSYRYAQTNHMISMMIGMTVGMQVGMMTGGVIGATDGYFMGAIVGVGLGTFLGVGTAWCCGPMAITQALMSGVMGGTMGSMIVAMMPPEKLIVFMPIFTLLNIAILVWFSFLFFRDCVIGERCHMDRPMPFWMTFGISSLVIGGLGGLMVLNPDHSENFRSGDPEMAKDNPFEVRALDQSKSTGVQEMKCGAGMSGGASMKH